MASKPLIKVLILGNSGVGKTSCMNQFVNKKFSRQHKTTIGADFLMKDMIVSNKEITLQIWDTAGQERFQSLGATFYRGADACILVYDITDLKSFQSLEGWKDEFLMHSQLSDPSDLASVCLGNKSDLEEQRVVPVSQAEEHCRNSLGIEHMEVSAKKQYECGKGISKSCNDGHGAKIEIRGGVRNDKKSLAPRRTCEKERLRVQVLIREHAGTDENKFFCIKRFNSQFQSKNEPNLAFTFSF